MPHSAAQLSAHQSDIADFALGELFPEGAGSVLTHLRMAALDCRCSARAEVQEACRAVSNDPFVSLAAYAELLVRTVGQILGRSPLFYAPGVRDVSEDEAWLLRLIFSIAQEDHVSAAFLVRSRVPRHHRRGLTLLASAVATASVA